MRTNLRSLQLEQLYFNLMNKVQAPPEYAKQDSDLLDSPISSAQAIASRERAADDSDEDQFLGHVEQLIAKTEHREMSKQEILLQAQVVELQIKCNSLSSLNERLLRKLESDEEAFQGNFQEQLSVGSERDDKEEKSCLVGDLTEIQGQFTEVEEIIAAYRTQLTDYQKQVAEHNKRKQEQIESLSQEIKELEAELYAKQRQLAESKKDCSRLRHRNEQLLIEVQNLSVEWQALADWKERHNSSQKNSRNKNQIRQRFMGPNFDDDSFLAQDYQEEQCMKQMEKLINKLAEELEHERNMSKKYQEEVKRLNIEMKNEEISIQKKNQEIYKLERQILELRRGKPNQSYDNKSSSYRIDRNNYSPSEEYYGEHHRGSQRGSQGPRVSANIYQQGSDSKRKSPTSNFYKNTSQNKQHPLDETPPIQHISNDSNQKLHRLTLEQLLRTNESSSYGNLMRLIVSKKIIELYSETEDKNRNRIQMTHQNIQVYNFFQNNFELLQIRILHTQSTNVSLTKQQYFYNAIEVLEDLISGFDKINGLLGEVKAKGFNAQDKNLSSRFTYVRMAIDAMISHLKKNKE